MKKLFLVLCVVIMFFGIVGCPSSNDLAAPRSFTSSVTPAPAQDVVTDGGVDEFDGNHAVPEPAALILLGAGLVGLAGFGRKKFFKKD